eukprot:ctg_190.g152
MLPLHQQRGRSALPGNRGGRSTGYSYPQREPGAEEDSAACIRPVATEQAIKHRGATVSGARFESQVVPLPPSLLPCSVAAISLHVSCWQASECAGRVGAAALRAGVVGGVGQGPLRAPHPAARRWRGDGG